MGLGRDARRSRRRAIERNRARIDELLQSDPPSLDSLPDEVIDVCGVRFHLHGVVHGQKRVLRTGPILPRLIAALVERDDGRHRLVRTEIGFPTIFGLPDTAALGYTARDLFERAGLGPFIRMATSLPVRTAYSVVRRVFPSRDPEFVADVRALADPRWLPVCLEVQDLVAVDHALQAQLNEKDKLQHFRWAHSCLQADAARAIVGPEVEDIHLVVGAGHVPDLRLRLGSPG